MVRAGGERASRTGLAHRGVRLALVSAMLFGAGAPLAKGLLGHVSPWLLAGLLYCGSGLGLLVIRFLRRAPRVHLAAVDVWPLAGAILSGGVLAPVLMMMGLSAMPASGASLLLNAEGLFTALLAWFVFRENVDRRVALGLVAILAGAVVLSTSSGTELGNGWAPSLVLGACLLWGLDNNLTRVVAATDASWLAAVKGLVAGPTNLVVALLLGVEPPRVGNVAAALVVGFFAYGASLVLYIVALRELGTARAGAYYSVAPFFGAVVAVGAGEALTTPLVLAGVLMAIGVWLHLTERHEHPHAHPAVTHDHSHVHDVHHDHQHHPPVAPGARHSHRHTHVSLVHTHVHYPDSDHRHGHEKCSVP